MAVRPWSTNVDPFPTCNESARSGVIGCVVLANIERIVIEAPPSHVTSAAPTTFDERFAAVSDRLLHICVGLVGADHAEDVVHDVYLRARARFGQLRDRELFDAWICRAAINLCYTRHRDRARWRDRLSALALRPRAVGEPDLGLRELIERLPPRERTLVVLHYGHGYRLEEIAELLDLTPVNARTILYRARRRLGDQLREAEA
jgi:RNA polymerase sigma-70 factor, ECF subfamily